MTALLSTAGKRSWRGNAQWDAIRRAGEPQWLSTLREAALASFELSGPPHARLESWRFTPTAALAGVDFEPASASDRLEPLTGRVLCPLGFHRVVLVNGLRESRHEALKDLPPGVKISGLVEALRDEPELIRPLLEQPLPAELPLATLATARFRDGIVLRVAKNTCVDRPIYLVHQIQTGADGRPQAAHMRVIVIIEDGAEAEFIEESLGDGSVPFWTNSVVQVILGDNAKLKHYRVAREHKSGRRTTALLVTVGRDARYESHVFNLGGALVREDLHLALTAPGGDAALNGLSLLHGDEIADHHTIVTHDTVGGTTRELYKAVVDEKARYIFDGLIAVQPGAQKTDAQVYNRNLLLSEAASVNTNPEFKIYADDVSCKHGGTIGQLSSEALFYMRARGIGADEARRLLVYAFGSEMVARVKIEPLRVALEAALRLRMPHEVEKS